VVCSDRIFSPLVIDGRLDQDLGLVVVESCTGNGEIVRRQAGHPLHHVALIR